MVFSPRIAAAVVGILFWSLPLAATADVHGKGWKPLPWHLFDLYHKFPDTGNFRSVEIDMDVKGDVPAGAQLYLSPLWGRFGDKGFYFGFLSDMYDPKRKRTIGRGLIYSRWGIGTLSDTRAPGKAWGFVGEKATSGEGDFVSIRQPLAWSQGRYTFILRKRRPSPSVTGKWLDLLVFEHKSGKWIDGGGLRFYQPALRLRSTLASFIEVFASRKKGKYAFPAALPKLGVTIGTPLVNGRFEPVSTRSRFSPKVPRLVTFKDLFGETLVRLGDIPVPASPLPAR